MVTVFCQLFTLVPYIPLASLDITGILCLLAVDSRSLRSDITEVNPANKQVNPALSPKKGNNAIKENNFNRLNFCHE